MGLVAISTDLTLLEQARSGEPGALEELLEAYQPRILRFGMKMCRDRSDAEDVLQETLLAMARSLRDFKGASSLSTWLYAIARSFCIKKRRRSRFAPELVSLEGGAQARVEQVPDAEPDPERQLSDRRLAAALERAIATLTPAYREVLVLRDVEGLSAAEVAEVTGLNVGAVKSRLHRARKAVREELRALLEEVPQAPPPARSCPDVVRLFSRKLEGDITAETCAELEQHVASCPTCRAACDSLGEVLALCRQAPLPEVPPSLRESIRVGMRALLARG